MQSMHRKTYIQRIEKVGINYMSRRFMIWDLLSYAIGSLVEKSSSEISEIVYKLSTLSDEEFQAVCKDGNLMSTNLPVSKKMNYFNLIKKCC